MNFLIAITIINYKKLKDKSYPKKPFITSSLQQSSQNELGFPVNTTMNIAQKLYESGFITYMRTDSTFISNEFQDKLNEFISNSYGNEYFQKQRVQMMKLEDKLKGKEDEIY